MRRPSRLVLAAAVAALLSLSACDFEIAGLIGDLGGPFNSSTNPEVQQVDEVQENKPDIKKAEKARDDYLKTRDIDKLGEALRANPDDPELYAHAFLQDALRGDDDRIDKGRQLLLDKIAADRKKKGLPDDANELERDYSRQLLEAQARYLAKATVGTFKKLTPPELDYTVYNGYCSMLRRHNAEHPNDGWLAAHHGDHGFPCT